MKKLLLCFFLLFIGSVKAQELSDRQLDSLYYSFLQMRGISIGIETDQHVTEPEIIKCGFGIVSQIKLNLERYSIEKQQLLESLLQRPAKHTSIVSSTGFFRIHYDTTGNEAPRYDPALSVEENVKQVAIALDSSYNFEVNFLDYPPPPPDNGEGGDNLYDVYITTAQGSYGFTQPESILGNQKYTSHIQIHYSFQGFYTKGFDAMRVTVAHELHHAIQLGNYTGDKTEIDLFFYEITSTAMEEFVYDDVNDYYAYMSHYFNNTGKPFARSQPRSLDGYDLAIWNIFLKDVFDFNILKRQWELFTQTRALSAIAASINERGSTFGNELNKFAIWTFFTGHRARPGVYFDEASEYPLVAYTSTINFSSGSPLQVYSKPTSNNFVAFINSSVVPADTLVTIITNSDYISGVDSINKDFQFDYTLGSDSSFGSVRLNDFYFAKFDVSQPVFWSVSEILNNNVLRENGTVTPPIAGGGELFSYPNPYFYNKTHDNIYILIEDDVGTEYDFNIYSSGMELVYNSILRVTNDRFGRKALIWNIRSLNTSIASGVYIYAIRAGDETSKGKLVIFNE